MGTGTGGRGIQETEDAAPQTTASPPAATHLPAGGKPLQQTSREREQPRARAGLMHVSTSQGRSHASWERPPSTWINPVARLAE